MADELGTVESTGESSLRDALIGAAREHGATDSDLPPPREDVVEAPAGVTEAQPKLGPQPDKTAPDKSAKAPEVKPGEQPRAPDGKFAPKAPDTAPAAPSAAPTDQPKADTPAVAGQDGANLPPILSPATWTAAEKAAFATAPRNVQEAFARRAAEQERHFHQKNQELSQLMNDTKSVAEAIKPYVSELRVNGIHEAQAIATWAEMNRLLTRDPKGGLQLIARQLGVNLADLQPPQAAADGYVDPTVQPLIAKVAQLEQQLQQAGTQPPAWYQQQERQRQEAQRNAQNAALNGEIEAFGKQAGADGQPQYPHLGDLMLDMVPIVQSLREKNPTAPNSELLATAYERAAWGHPEIRAHMVETSRRADEAKRQADAAAAAKDAQRKAVSLNGNPGGPTAPVRGRSVRELLEQAAAGAA